MAASSGFAGERRSAGPVSKPTAGRPIRRSRGRADHMRRLLITTIVAGALAAAGCGSDASNTAEKAQDQAGKAQDQAGKAAQQAGAQDLAAATKDLAGQIAQAARELADNPNADVDADLQQAQERANDLADRAQNEVSQDQPDLASALRRADMRLADAASALREADNADEVQQVLSDQIGPVSSRLSDAIGAAEKVTGKDTDKQLQKARDQIDQLRDLAG
jgi:hypothetical protein